LTTENSRIQLVKLGKERKKRLEFDNFRFTSSFIPPNKLKAAVISLLGDFILAILTLEVISDLLTGSMAEGLIDEWTQKQGVLHSQRNFKEAIQL
jgi:hypothetical protein